MCFFSQYKSTIYIMVPLPTLCFKMYLTVFVLDIVFGLYNNISTVECNNSNKSNRGKYNIERSI